MRAHGTLREEEATDAAWEATRGALSGATRVKFLVGDGLRLTDISVVGVLYGRSRSRCICLFPGVSRINYSIQDVCIHGGREREG
jgi:hypothetical protein